MVCCQLFAFLFPTVQYPNTPQPAAKSKSMFRARAVLGRAGRAAPAPSPSEATGDRTKRDKTGYALGPLTSRRVASKLGAISKRTHDGFIYLAARNRGGARHAR